ncbi:MAG: glycosyltransferase family 39 protein [Candidatus Micrarchaeaceae archaeon]
MQMGIMHAKSARPDKKSGHAIIYILLAVLLVSLAAYLFTHLMAPSFYDDDTTYEMLAYWLYTGNSDFIFLPPYSARLLQIIPIAIFYKLLGVNFLSNAMWNIISTVLLVIITFYIGKELYNEYAGVLSAFLLSFFPILIMLGSSGNETIPMAMFAALAVLSFIRGYSRDSSRYYFVTGISIFAAFLASPLGAVIGVIIVGYLLILYISPKQLTGIRITRKSAHILSGVLLSVALLTIFDYIVSGNPLLIIEISIGFASGPYFIAPAAPSPYYEVLLLPSLYFKPVVAAISTSLFFYISIAASAYLLFRKVRVSYLPVFWFAFGLLYLIAGPMYINLFPFRYATIPQEWRFLTLLSSPMCILPSILIVKIYSAHKKRRPAALIIGAVIVASLVFTSAKTNVFNYNSYLNGMLPQFYLASYLSSLPNSTTIYLPLYLPNIIVYMHFDNTSRFKYYSGFITNCSSSENYDYIIIVNSTSSSSNNVLSCPSWQQVDFLKNETDVSKTAIYLYLNKAAT